MSLVRLKREGWFEPPKQYSFKFNLLTEKDLLSLTLNGKVRIASTMDNNVYDLNYEANTDKITVETLPVHTKQTASMANYTEQEFLKYLQVESTYDKSLLEEVLPEPKLSWTQSIYQFIKSHK